MKKVIRKFKIKTINKIKHLFNIIYKLLKVIVQSVIICFPVTTVLAISNSLFGVNIRLSYYIKLAILATLGISCLLVIFNWKNIIAKPAKSVKATKKSVPANTYKKKQKSINRNRRNIS